MAKRQADLFDWIASFGALRAAAKKAILGKRRKPGGSAYQGALLATDQSSKQMVEPTQKEEVSHYPQHRRCHAQDQAEPNHHQHKRDNTRPVEVSY